MLTDEDLVNTINLHLQELGKNITVAKLIQFLACPDIMEKYGIQKKISEWTARCYLQALGYHFCEAKKGQYADGHERPDVVVYRDRKYVPALRALKNWVWNYIDGLPEYGPFLEEQDTIIWFHDKSIFYAHDRRRKTWYHKDAPTKPYAKGEGKSLMITDFVSAEFGWLWSKDGTHTACCVMKPGKNHDGYFTSDDIVEQANAAMDIVTVDYPEYKHIFIYDNTPSHLKRVDGTPSSQKMPKFSPREGNWLVEVTQCNPDGKPIYNTDRTFQKVKIPMSDGSFSDQPQSFYFPEGHSRAGIFKGMATILEEHGFTQAQALKAECKSFKCQPPALDCCCRWLLFNQPDFANAKNIVEDTFNAWGFIVYFLPKFHCELNFIEQCWGYAKRLYQLNLESSWEDQLELNAIAALDAVPIISMHRWVLKLLASKHNLDLSSFQQVFDMFMAVLGCLQLRTWWCKGCLGCQSFPGPSSVSRDHFAQGWGCPNLLMTVNFYLLPQYLLDSLTLWDPISYNIFPSYLGANCPTLLSMLFYFPILCRLPDLDEHVTQK